MLKTLPDIAESRTEQGFTLIELMIVIAIMAVVASSIFFLGRSLSSTSTLVETQATVRDEARKTMMAVLPQLRQAATGTINRAALPSASIRFRVAEDLNGNGTAVDDNANLELGPWRQITPDFNDINGDGQRVTQLVLIKFDNAGAVDNVRVIANDLCPEDANGNGLLDAGEDTNGNGQLDAGIQFTAEGPDIRIDVRTEHRLFGTDDRVPCELAARIHPRN